MLPPLILKLPPETVSVGFGTAMVAELTPFVTVAMPCVVMVCASCAGITTELPPLMLKVFVFNVRVGLGT